MSRSAKSKPPQEGPTRDGRRHGWAKAAGETVLGEAAGIFARAGFTDATLLLRWAEIASPQIARIAQPLKWQEDGGGAILTLKCEAGAILFLQHQTRELIDRLNAYLGRGRIGRLKLVAGTLAQSDEPPNHPAVDSPTPPGEPPSGKPQLPEALARLAEARARLGPGRPKRPKNQAAARPD